MRRLWTLDPAFAYLNHGAFGACPRSVLAAQDGIRARLERQPARFFDREYPTLLASARDTLGAFLGADPDDLAFLPNATTGVNTILRSLVLSPGDRLLVTDHAYRACRNALDAVAARGGAEVTVARVPFPLRSDDEILGAVLEALAPRTRLALLDHVTSPTGLVWPVERLVAELSARGVEVLVDGAHAPGMVPLDLGRLGALGASYYAGNGHKWLYAPKGCGFLWVRRDRQGGIRPLSVSHGASLPLEGSSRFRMEFDWTGTDDPSPFLCLPAALRFVASLPGGWEGVRARNRALALRGRSVLAETVGVPLPCPDEMIGSLAALPLPPGDAATLQDELHARGFEVPIVPWPEPPHRLVRISAAPYNAEEEYRALAAALSRVLL